MIDQHTRQRQVDELINAIHRKLEENKPVLSKSSGYGRLTWRTDKSGNIEVDLEPKL